MIRLLLSLPLLLCLLPIQSVVAEDRSPDEIRKAWDTYQSSPATSPTVTFPHGQCFRASALMYDLPESLLLAVARGESDFNETARSRANAHGVMQIQWPGTAKHLGIHRLSELYDPCTNIDAGTRYLKELLKRYSNDLHLTLAAYNYGPGRISAGEEIPDGANWYSAYIFRHLQYVLGSSKPGSKPRNSVYSELGRTTLVSFGEPYRAQAFVDGLEARAPTVSVDWFRKSVGNFIVVLTYDDERDFEHSATQLANVGFVLD